MMTRACCNKSSARDVSPCSASTAATLPWLIARSRWLPVSLELVFARRSALLQAVSCAYAAKAVVLCGIPIGVGPSPGCSSDNAALSERGGRYMKLVYITEAGDDTNDGVSVEKAVYSWERALEIKGGDNSIQIFVAAHALERVLDEIDLLDDLAAYDIVDP